MIVLNDSQKIKINNLFNNKKFLELEREIELISKTGDLNPFLFNLLGVSKIQKKNPSQLDFENALTLFKEATIKYPAYEDALCNYALLGLKLNRYEEPFKLLKEFVKKGYKITGVDKSKAMIEKAQTKHPGCDFVNSDALNSLSHKPKSFTHILCTYFTIYYIENKLEFFKNAFDWLKSNGTMTLHLVNRDKFNPIVNAADVLIAVSPQKYAKKRITNSLVKFKNFQYKADFKLQKHKNKAIFDETFKDDSSGNVRQNKHTLHMDTQKNILSLAKSVGFILHGKIDMVGCNYEYQYLYVLRKP